MMAAAVSFVAGLALAGMVADQVLIWRVYRMFPAQKRRWWPGAGFWMAWKSIRLLRGTRDMLGNVHAAATLFPLGAHHSTVTREFVETIRRYSNLKPEAKS